MRTENMKKKEEIPSSFYGLIIIGIWISFAFSFSFWVLAIFSTALWSSLFLMIISLGLFMGGTSGLYLLMFLAKREWKKEQKLKRRFDYED